MSLQNRIAIIGSGPRGLAVLERLAFRLLQEPSPVEHEILLVDDFQVGAGRIWRTSQGRDFLMNTVISQMTMFSGPADEREARPGAGPSFNEWIQTHSDPEFATLGPNDYAPRYVYGQYLRFVLQSIEIALRGRIGLRLLGGRVVDMLPEQGLYSLVFADGRTESDVGHVVLATGHDTATPTEMESGFVKFADVTGTCHFLKGDSAADLPLDGIAAGDSVGIIGLGLGFYDIISALTMGRGGGLSKGREGG